MIVTDVSSIRNSTDSTTSPSTVITTTTTSVSTITTKGTTSGSIVTTNGTTSGSIFTTNGTTPTVNVTASPASHLPNTSTMGSGTAVGIAIGVILLLLACVLVGLYFLRKTGRLKCLTARGRTRRSSTSSSRHPLEPDESEAGDTLPRLTEGDMFAIAEHDNDYDKDAGGATEDGYFYDEVFGSSAFEDETTNASNKDLFSATETDSIPDLLLRVDRITFN